MLRRSALLALLGTLGWVSPARAREPVAREPFVVPEDAPARPREPSGFDLGADTASTPLATRGGYVHAFGFAGVGRGLRLNNPYRLETVLGDDAESLSLSATYLDLAVGATVGDARALQHGAVAHLSIATDGIAQEVLSVSYLMLHPFGSRFLATGRAGVPVVLEPDLNAGFELGLGGACLLSATFGISAELVGSLFYGAATLDRSVTVIPMISLQAGLWFDYEVLP
jgi:hypothetical protein